MAKWHKAKKKSPKSSKRQLYAVIDKNGSLRKAVYDPKTYYTGWGAAVTVSAYGEGTWTEWHSIDIKYWSKLPQ